MNESDIQNASQQDNAKEQKTHIKKKLDPFVYLLFVLLLIVAAATVDSVVKTSHFSFPKLANNVFTKPSNNIDDTNNSNYPDTNSQTCILSDEENYLNTTKLNFNGEEKIDSEVDSTKFKILYKDLSITELTKTKGNIISFAFNNKEDQLAFILENTDSVDKNREVYVYDLKDKKTQKVYEAKSKTTSDSDYNLEIKAVGFSQDSSLLAITTTTGILTYNFETKDIKELFDSGPKKEGDWGPYGYYAPMVSDNKKYISYIAGNYEGISTLIYDLTTNKVIDPRYGAYISGSEVSGWYENNMIVQENYVFEEDNVRRNRIYSVSPKDLKNLNVIVLSAPVMDTASSRININAVLNDKIYYTSIFEERSDKFTCNNMGEKIPVNRTVDVLHEVDINTKKSKDLIKIDTTEVSGTSVPTTYTHYDKHTIEGKEVIVVELSKVSDFTSSELYKLNDDTSLTKLQL